MAVGSWTIAYDCNIDRLHIHRQSRFYDPSDRGGWPLIGFVNPRAPRLMTGTYTDSNGDVQPFYAVKEEFPSGTSPTSTITDDSFFGRWELGAPVAEGHYVDVLSADDPNETFSGHYYHDSGWVVVNATANEITGEFSFAMPGVSD